MALNSRKHQFKTKFQIILRCKTYSDLHVLLREGRRELDGASESLGNRDNVRAVNEILLAKNLELRHGSFELGHHQVLVIYAGN